MAGISFCLFPFFMSLLFTRVIVYTRRSSRLIQKKNSLKVYRKEWFSTEYGNNTCFALGRAGQIMRIIIDQARYSDAHRGKFLIFIVKIATVRV